MMMKSYELSIPGEIAVTFLNYGAIIQSIHVPDRKGEMGDVVLGFDDKEQYLSSHPYFGGIIGRFANRIKDAQFEIDHRIYHVSKNDGKNTLHGGKVGLDKRFWRVERVDKNSFKLSVHSEHLDQGFPGNLSLEVVYSITRNRELIIDYKAKSDKKTFVNFTNHSYFNLADKPQNVLGHELKIEADQIVEVDKNLMPTGNLMAAQGTYDFRGSKVLAEVIPEKLEGIDLTYVLNKRNGIIASLFHPESGRKLSLETTEPGLQAYTGHLLDGNIIGKKKVLYKKYQGICLEPQHFPDTPHHSHFPSTLLIPDDTYRSRTIYRFSAN